MAVETIMVNGVTEILKGLSILVASEISLAWGVKDEFQKLKKTLDMILDLMVDAETKQVQSKFVRGWLKELKDIAYEAEDILDEHAYEVMHQHEMTRKRDKVRNFFSRSSAIVFRQKIAHEIKVVNEKFNEIAKRKENLGLQIIELGMPSRTTNLDETSKLRETDSILDMNLKIIGRDNDKSNIIHMLLHNQEGVNIQVISIVGMGGLGKTTLAQLIYDDHTVKKHFDLKMWVFVSDDFDVNKLFVKILESITNKTYDDVSNIDVIARQLQQHLSGKKYLLVLDDVWNKKREEWVNFRKPLLVGADGSKIIVTTRSDDVASIMGGKLHSYKLGILNQNDSWSLFKERAAFGHVGGVVETPTLTTIGKELVGKCGGLPLAIIFLGSLLRGKEEIDWNKINENQIWNQSSDEDESRILPILKLSYDHLPSHLKQCFSYFSLYSKDYRFSRDKMILMWIAEGFILQPSRINNMSMEEVGNEYLNILLHNSFFQDVVKDGAGQVLSFKMHDLVHDLAIEVAGDRECLLLMAHENMKTIHNIRRLRLLDFSEGMSKTICKVLQDKTTLRTLLCYGTVKKVENAFDGLKRLRVLDLSDTPNIEEIPSSLMDNLKHLRFLHISNTQITNLPKSLTRLYHLQTLILLNCVNLKELPKGIGKLINLRHLNLPVDMNLPREIGQLTSLRTLYPCNVGNNDMEDTSSGGRGGGCGIEVLEGLNLLSDQLAINHLRNVRSGIEAQRANLMGKKNLNKIFLSWHNYASSDGEYSKDEEAVLEALQPHPNLKMLDIDQYFGVKLPRWMGGDPCLLPNLVVLQLGDCPKCEQLVGFGKLPSLKVLKLFKMDGIKCLGNEFYYNNNNSGGGGGGGGGAVAASVILFPSLKKLVLSDMGALEEWVDIPPTVSCFPCLEEIHIYRCSNLRITPTTRFPSLKVLFLKEISGRLVVVPLITTNLNSLESVQLGKITELRLLLPYRLLQDNKLKVLKVIDCLDFQGFRPSEEDQNEEEGFTSLRLLALLRLPALKFLPDIRSLTSLEELYIEDCESLKPLPEDLTCLPSSLKNLKVVEIWNVKEVDDFKFKVLSNTVEDIAESEGLTSLEGELENLESVEVRKNADKANFKRPQDIKRVALTWSDETMLDEDDESSNDSLVLEGLRPHPSLRSLVITCFMVPTFPKWMGDPLCLPNLVELELHGCNRCEQLPALGKLPFLRLLTVREMIAIKRLGREFYYGGGEGSILLSEEEAANTTIAFPSLNELVLDDMPNLEEWVESLQPKVPFSTSASSSTSISSFPLLESIEIKLCPKLKSIPTLFPSLSNLEFYSSNGTSLSSVVKSNLGSLVSIYIEEVPRLFFLPQGLLTNNNVLQSLDICDCPDFQGFIHQGEEIELFNSNISSLQFLTILDCPILKFLPGIRGMTSLQRLTILDCNKEFHLLPNDLECLSSLEELEFGFSHPNGIEEAEEYVGICCSTSGISHGGLQIAGLFK